MGLKLQYSGNLHHASLLKLNEEASAIALTAQTVQIMLDCRIQAKFTFIESCMEKLRNESIKNIMLKHEEIFKQQVLELHRLYRVQKFLMAELSGKEMKMDPLVPTAKTPVSAPTNNKFQSSTSTSETTYSSHATTTRNHPIALPNSECTSLPGIAAMTNASNCSDELQQAAGGELHHEKSCSTDDCNLELTLSIGCGSGKKKMRNWKQITNEPTQLLS